MLRSRSPEELRLRYLLVAPFWLLLAFAGVLVVAAAGAWGTASFVRYPDAVPVIAGFLAALPSALFAVAGGVLVWRRTSEPFLLRGRMVVLGVIPFVAAMAMLLAYAAVVGDPDHYRGSYDPVLQRWNPELSYNLYLATILGVASLFPMGVLGVLAKLMYIDGIQKPKLSTPEGIDPIGSIMSNP